MVRPYVMVVSCNIKIAQEGAREKRLQHQSDNEEGTRTKRFQHQNDKEEGERTRACNKEGGLHSGEGRKRKHHRASLGRQNLTHARPGSNPKSFAYEATSLSIRLGASAWRRGAGFQTIFFTTKTIKFHRFCSFQAA